MKKVVLILIVIMLLGIYLFKLKEPHINIEDGIKSGSYTLSIDVPESDGAKVIFSHTGKFNDKKFTGSAFDIVGSSSKGSVVALLNDIEPLGIKQFLLPFFVNYGGSGTFLYIGLFEIDKKKIKHLDSIFVGDRVELLNISAVDNLKVILEYNDYKKGRSMSTIPDKYIKKDLLIEDKKFLKSSID